VLKSTLEDEHSDRPALVISVESLNSEETSGLESLPCPNYKHLIAARAISIKLRRALILAARGDYDDEWVEKSLD
jgi:hypothetical protein